MKYILLLIFLFSSIFTQFGKNIVQYDEYNWKFIQTKHFDVYYYNNGKEQAEIAAYHCEQAYQHIEKLIGWGLKKRSDIIIYNSHNAFQQTNVIDAYMEEGVGGVTELMKNRMVVPFDGSLKEFKHVLYHELVHVFINDGVYGGTLMNMLKTNNVILPLWMNEGLAEYLAQKWGVNSDMWMRDLAINSNQMLEINQLNGYLAYRGGQSVWRYITSKWGDEVIAQIFNNIIKYGDINKGLEETLGVNIEELTEQWHNYLKKQYWGDIDIRDNVMDIARQLTDHEKLYNTYNIAPSVSPDGELAAIYSNKNGFMSIYLISARTGEFITKIATGQVTSEIEELHILKPGISWSSNGEQIVFAAKSGHSDALIFVNIDNPKTIIKKNFKVEGIFRPVWNPKYNKIAFIGNNGLSSDIYIYNLDDDSLNNITNDIFSDLQVSWSHDGESLIFISDRGNNIIPKQSIDIISILNMDLDNNDIYKYTNNQIIRLTNTDFNESYPSYSSDGNTIAYISDKSGINNIYLTINEFKTSEPITNVQTGITQCSWGTNNQIIFTGFYKSGYDIFIMSNVQDKLINQLSIPSSKWKEEKESNFLRKESTYISNNTNSYKNFIFDKSTTFINSSDKFILDESLLLDSLGMHISHDYVTKFTLDYAQASYVFDLFEGGQGMGVFYFSDILGNHKFSLQTSLQFDIDQSDIYFRYRFLKERINHEISLINYAYFTDANISGDGMTTIFDLNRDLSIGYKAENPFSKFSRIEGGITYNHLAKKQMEYQYDYWGGTSQSSYFLDTYTIIEPNIKYVWDNTRSFYLYNVGGSRAYIKYTMSPDIKINDFSYSKLEIDARKYFELSYVGKISFASRFYLGSSWGKNARITAIGGAPAFFHSDSNLINPEYQNQIMEVYPEYQFWSMNNLQFPIRGYNIGQKFGTKAMMLNVELRLPFLMYYFPTIKYLGQLFGVMFIDMGVAWDNHFPSFSNRESWNLNNNVGWVMSYGIGPRFILFGMPWQLDYAWQYNPYEGRISSDKWYLSIGLDF